MKSMHEYKATLIMRFPHCFFFRMRGKEVKIKKYPKHYRANTNNGFEVF